MVGSDTESIRQSYRPSKILALFVGESAPKSGKFFYCGNTALKGYMEDVMNAAGLGGNDNFLERFKSYGWYLDDLVLEPVDGLPKLERRAKCREARSSLTTRIREYHPLAIVSLLRSIEEYVEDAAIAAGSTAARYSVPFAGNGQQGRFKIAMAHILPKLPKLVA